MARGQSFLAWAPGAVRRPGPCVTFIYHGAEISGELRPPFFLLLSRLPTFFVFYCRLGALGEGRGKHVGCATQSLGARTAGATCVA